MKKLIAAVAILLLAVLVPVVQGQTSTPYTVERGAVAYTDTLLWHKGLSNAKTCTLIAAEKDTSQKFDLANIEVFAAIFHHTKGQGRAGDSVTYALGCSLQVSIDGQNWLTPTGMPVYQVTATASSSEPLHYVYASEIDSVVTLSDVGMGRAKAHVIGAKWGRFILTQTADLKDTCYFKGADYRLYNTVIR